MSAYVVLSTQYQSLGTLMQTAVTPTSDVVAGGFTLVILDSLICISREDQPRCTFCDCALTVVHMLLKCPHYSIVRQRYFSVTTLKDVFEILQAHYQMTPRHLIHTAHHRLPGERHAVLPISTDEPPDQPHWSVNCEYS